MKKSLVYLTSTVLASSAFALTASDDASNIAYNDGWATGDNGGTGFLDWSISSNPGADGFAGVFIGDSTNGAGDINTGGQSFGIFANGDAASSVEAVRSFSTSLTTNDQFTFDFAVNFSDGNRGFNLRSGGDNVIGLNIFSGGASINSAFTNNATIAETYDYGGDDAMLQAVLTVISASEVQYEISRSSSLGNQNVLFAGSVSGVTGNIDNFNFYINGDATGDGASDNLYFNSLSVTQVPEPSAFSLFAGLLVSTLLLRRRR